MDSRLKCKFSTPPCFLPRPMRIAEDRLDTERHVELVVFGELVSIVEADSPAQTCGSLPS